MASEKKPEPKWLLEVTEAQAREIYKACNLVCRIRMGQFEDLQRELTPRDQSSEATERTYQVLKRLLDLVKLAAFPDMPLSLTGLNKDLFTERLWDIYVAMRNTITRKSDELSGERDPFVLITVDRDDPVHRMVSDWPMVKMTYIPAKEINNADRGAGEAGG